MLCGSVWRPNKLQVDLTYSIKTEKICLTLPCFHDQGREGRAIDAVVSKRLRIEFLDQPPTKAPIAAPRPPPASPPMSAPPAAPPKAPRPVRAAAG